MRRPRASFGRRRAGTGQGNQSQRDGTRGCLQRASRPWLGRMAGSGSRERRGRRGNRQKGFRSLFQGRAIVAADSWHAGDGYQEHCASRWKVLRPGIFIRLIAKHVLPAVRAIGQVLNLTSPFEVERGSRKLPASGIPDSAGSIEPLLAYRRSIGDHGAGAVA